MIKFLQTGRADANIADAVSFFLSYKSYQSIIDKHNEPIRDRYKNVSPAKRLGNALENVRPLRSAGNPCTSRFVLFCSETKTACFYLFWFWVCLVVCLFASPPFSLPPKDFSQHSLRKL